MNPYIKRIIELTKNKKFILTIFIIGLIFILYNFVFFIGNNTVDIPFGDQWGGVSDIIQGKFDILKILFYQHNEHRIGVGLLVMKFLAKYSNWSQILEIKVISLLIISSSLLISYIKYGISKKIGILDIFIPLVMLNIFQYENIIWGFQIALVLPLFFLCCWIFALKIKSAKLRYCILTILSLLSAYSSFHGLILLALTVIISFIEYFKYKLTSKKLFILTIITNIFIIFSYFIGYKKNLQITPSLSLSMPVIKYFSLAVSNGFFYSMRNPFINIFITITILTFFILGIWKLLKDRQRNNNIIIGCLLILYSLTFASIISVGRSSLGIEQALGSRYITFTMLLPIGLFFIFSSLKYGTYLKIILLGFVASNLLFLNGKIMNDSNSLANGKRLVFECYKKATIYNLDVCFNLFPIYPDENYLNQRIVKVLQYKKINKFDKVNEIASIINDLPNAISEPQKASQLFTDFQNIKFEAPDFVSLNTDPNMLIAITANMKGISWVSTATGNAKVYLSFSEKDKFSEKYAFIITPLRGISAINIEKIQEIMGKNILKLRIDPTDKAETFQVNNLQVYK